MSRRIIVKLSLTVIIFLLIGQAKVLVAQDLRSLARSVTTGYSDDAYRSLAQHLQKMPFEEKDETPDSTTTTERTSDERFEFLNAGPNDTGIPCEPGWNVGKWQFVPTVRFEVETILASDAIQNSNYALFTSPRSPVKTESIDITGQSSQFGFQVGGPQIGNFQAGGYFLMDFHGSQPARNEPGAYFLRAYGELKNERWRFAFGQMRDVIGTWNATTVNWTGVAGIGFLGENQRGTLLMERYFNPNPSMCWTLTGALTQPVVTDLAGEQNRVGQDNGLPNFESKLTLGMGHDCGQGRPFELAIAGLFGEYFSGASQGQPFPSGLSNTSKSHAGIAGLQWNRNSVGFRGQAWHGRGIGSYLGGIAQSLNPDNGETIRASGGFGQLWFKPRPRVTISGIFGADNPRDVDLVAGQRSKNQVIGGNVVFDITDSMQIGMDVWQLKTDYSIPSLSNQATVVMLETSLTF